LILFWKETTTMNFKPCTEQEIVDRKLWPKGGLRFRDHRRRRKGQSERRQSHDRAEGENVAA